MIRERMEVLRDLLNSSRYVRLRRRFTLTDGNHGARGRRSSADPIRSSLLVADKPAVPHFVLGLPFVD